MAASYRKGVFLMRKLFISVTVSIILLFNVAFTNAAGFDSQTVFNTAGLVSGVIKVSFNTDSDKKLKVLVEKSGKNISYNLKNDGTVESFPLQLGNGDYKVSIMENIEGNRYKYVSTENVNLKLDDQKEVFLASVQNINWNSDMAAIGKAKELTAGLKSDGEKVAATYNYIVNNFTYDYDKLSKLENDYIPDIDSTLAAGKGICYDYASLFAAMLRSEGIPAKLVKGYSENVNGYHAWNEVFNSKTGSWEIYDTTYDSQMKAAKAKYNTVKKSSEYTKVNEY